MSVWARAAASAAASAAAAAELLTAVASLFFSFSLGEWGPVLGISLAQPIFHLKDPDTFKKKSFSFFFGD